MQVDVQLGARAYPILIEAGLLARPQKWIDFIHGEHVLIVTNATVAPLYLEVLQKNIVQYHKKIITVVLDDGEAYKTGASLMQILDAMLAAKCDRKTTVIALGGGVIGDVAGLAAALYMRGVALIQIPTTLLSQVDSSVGGKTAINHPLGKNMIGAFHQPIAVLIDPDTLTTLPQRELRCGLAEMIKHGAALDMPYFEWMQNNTKAILALDLSALTTGIAESCRLKAGVVERDERESGERALLNFGHTFAHAIEVGAGYGTWFHGEAVAAGMVIAAQLSSAVTGCPSEVSHKIQALLAEAHLPPTPPKMSFDRWYELMSLDKKNNAGKIHFVLLESLGVSRTQAVERETLRQNMQGFTA